MTQPTYARCFLTQALPLILLYRQERTQYDITVQKLPGKSPSEIYGAEHLLRVFGESAWRCYSVCVGAGDRSDSV